MDATAPLSFEAYLGTKTEEQLRSYLYKLQGNAARLNGPKNAMVQRLLQSTTNLGRERFSQVFPGYARARTNWQRAAAMLQTPGARGGPQALNRASSRASSTAFVPPPARTPRFDFAPGQAGPAMVAAAAAVTPPQGARKRSLSVDSPGAAHAVLGDRFLCKLCMATEVAIVVTPCGHLCMCEPCCRTLHRSFYQHRMVNLMFTELLPKPPCPMCRGPMHNTVKIFN